MQILPQLFADFLYLCEYSNIKLSGPLNNIVRCKLHINTNNGVQVTFGKGWRKFCRLNNIMEGICLEFTCHQFMFNNVIIVEII
jgi:hypothetical protein